MRWNALVGHLQHQQQQQEQQLVVAALLLLLEAGEKEVSFWPLIGMTDVAAFSPAGFPQRPPHHTKHDGYISIFRQILFFYFFFFSSSFLFFFLLPPYSFFWRFPKKGGRGNVCFDTSTVCRISFIWQICLLLYINWRSYPVIYTSFDINDSVIATILIMCNNPSQDKSRDESAL